MNYTCDITELTATKLLTMVDSKYLTKLVEIYPDKVVKQMRKAKRKARKR